MERDRSSIQRATDGEAAAPGAPGRRSRVEASYPTLARKLGPTAGEPSIHDAATVAIEHKDGGGPVDAGVAAQVGAHLGTDFSQVRVHSDPLAQEASAAMGARAFAHGGDVFLARGESADGPRTHGPRADPRRATGRRWAARAAAQGRGR
jgi:hypothetical protein